MPTILHIDSSILGDHSVSRALTAEIVSRLQKRHANSQVLRRDLAANPAMHLSAEHLAVFQGNAAVNESLAQDVTAGSAFVDELFAADIIVMGAPMYNFSVPTQLKAWLDRVSVAGRTFRYATTGPEGLVTGKQVYVASARGGVYTQGSPTAQMDHQETYLLAQLAFLGMTDVTVIRAEGLAMGDASKAAAIAQASAAMADALPA
jgi:FMN-dependent NADH-azoreductase